jgi:hypothetical protein
MEPKPPRESVTTLAQVMLIDDANPQARPLHDDLEPCLPDEHSMTQLEATIAC